MYYNNYRSPQLHTRSAVFNLIMLNVLVYAAVEILPLEVRGMDFRTTLSLFYPASQHFLPHQLLTHLLTHGNIWHLFFNMFNLYMFGSMLERVWGQKRLLIFFFVTGLGAALLYLLAQGIEIYMLCGSFFPSRITLLQNPHAAAVVNSSCLGASGAVFGMLAAAAMLFGNTEVYVYGVLPMRLRILVILMIALEFYLQFQNSPGDNVAHLAHLTGALMGYMMVKMWSRDRERFF